MKLKVFVAGLCISIAPVASGPAFAQTPDRDEAASPSTARWSATRRAA